MEKKEVKWGKWFALGLGGLIGLSHIGMIGTPVSYTHLRAHETG